VIQVRVAERRIVRAVALLVLQCLVPSVLGAQIPGGKGEDVDLQAAQFRAAVLGEVNPLLASWRDAWSGRGDVSIESHYADSALLVIPGGTVLRGRRQIGVFAGRARLATGGLTTSMLDFDAGDGLAYIYGNWEARPVAGTGMGTGPHITVVMKDRGRWLIRTQVLASADSPSAGPMHVVTESASMTPLTADRIGSGSGAGAHRALYGQLSTTLATLRAAWTSGDASAIEALLRDDALLQLPDGAPSMGGVAAADLAVALPSYRNLHTVELDFQRSGTMAFVVGRYYAERRSGGARTGLYIAIFKNSGGGWLIRALMFT